MTFGIEVINAALTIRASTGLRRQYLDEIGGRCSQPDSARDRRRHGAFRHGFIDFERRFTTMVVTRRLASKMP
jgi:hypothetical protein